MLNYLSVIWTVCCSRLCCRCHGKRCENDPAGLMAQQSDSSRGGRGCGVEARHELANVIPHLPVDYTECPKEMSYSHHKSIKRKGGKINLWGRELNWTLEESEMCL